MEIISNEIQIPFADKLSEKIYNNLIKFQKYNKLDYLFRAITLSGLEPDPAYQWYADLKKLTSNKMQLILYGLGKTAKAMEDLELKMRNAPGFFYFPFLGDIDWYGMCDKNSEEFPDGFMGKRVMSLKELQSLKDENIRICVGAPDHYKEIENELINLGIKREQIVRHIYPHVICNEDKQYFDDFLEIKKETTMVDGGAFRCDTLKRFIHWNHDKGYDNIAAYEPDSINYDICKKKISQSSWKNVELFQAGLSDREDSCMFIAKGNDSSHISNVGDQEVRTVSIDNSLRGKDISFIKLDVEGYELQALKGARESIKKYHPRIAIALYHKKEDILEIPQYIMQLSKDYKFYLRIYSNSWFEVTLYAI